MPGFPSEDAYSNNLIDYPQKHTPLRRLLCWGCLRQKSCLAERIPLEIEPEQKDEWIFETRFLRQNNKKVRLPVITITHRQQSIFAF